MNLFLDSFPHDQLLFNKFVSSPKRIGSRLFFILICCYNLIKREVEPSILLKTKLMIFE